MFQLGQQVRGVVTGLFIVIGREARPDMPGGAIYELLVCDPATGRPGDLIPVRLTADILVAV